MSYIDTPVGDGDGTFSFSDYTEGYNTFEDIIGYPPKYMYVNRRVLHTLQTAQKFIHKNDVYGGGDKQYEEFSKRVNGGIGLYVDVSVHKLDTDEWDDNKSIAIMTDGGRRIRIEG